MVLLYVSLGLVTLVTLLYYYFTRTFNYWKNRGVSGPDPVPIFGNLTDSALRRKNIGLVFHDLYNSMPNEKVIGVYRMTTPCLLLRDLDVIKHVMIKDFDAFADRGVELSKEGLGRNLFHADGDTWRVLRYHFTPIFTSGKLKNMLHLITERGDRFVDYVNSMVQQNPEQEAYRLVQKFTISAIAACAFGLEIDALNNPEAMAELKSVDDILFNVSYARELDMMYPGILKKLNVSFFPKPVVKFFYGLIKDVMAERNGLPTNRKDFVDLILELKQKGQIEGTKRSEDDKQRSLELTDDIIAAQTFVFYVAGYETSATTMGFLLYEMAKNPDIQQKLIADIDQVLKKYNGEVTYECVKDMTYLEKVFDETLRLYPLVEPLQRKAQVDYKIPGTSVTIPKETIVLVSSYGIHRDPKYHPDPEKFDPERFTPEAISKRHVCAYMPFGVGPRNCIGMRFAKVQSRICMIKFFSQFRVEMCPRTQRNLVINPIKRVIGPSDGIPLYVIKRK